MGVNEKNASVADYLDGEGNTQGNVYQTRRNMPPPRCALFAHQKMTMASFITEDWYLLAYFPLVCAPFRQIIAKLTKSFDTIWSHQLASYETRSWS